MSGRTYPAPALAKYTVVPSGMTAGAFYAPYIPLMRTRYMFMFENSWQVPEKLNRTSAMKRLKKMRAWARSETLKTIDEMFKNKSLGRASPETIERFRLILIEESEHIFETTVIDQYPHVTTPKLSEGWQARLDDVEDHIQWLKKTFKEGTYVAFSDMASGKHKDCCKSVYFKDVKDLIYYKLSKC